jgi:hypothetical protein
MRRGIQRGAVSSAARLDLRLADQLGEERRVADDIAVGNALELPHGRVLPFRAAHDITAVQSGA